MSLLHSQSGLALVLSLLLLMVINYYYPATQSTADVMSPTSLGQRGKKKKKPGVRAGAGSWQAASGALPPPRVRWGFGRSRGRYRHPSLSSLLFVWRASMCCQLLPTFQVKVFFVFCFLGRKHKKNVTTPRCLPLSPDFGCCLEMSPNIVPKRLERLRAACGSHRSHRSRVGSCIAAPGGAAKQTQTHHQAERSQPLAFRAGKTHYNHLSCKE